MEQKFGERLRIEVVRRVGGEYRVEERDLVIKQEF